MNALYITDLHGDIEKYEKILRVAEKQDIKYIINGGDMLPKHGDLFKDKYYFIHEYLPDYFNRLQDNGITYICMLGNDDIRAYDEIFDDVCNRFDNVYNIANRRIVINDYEFIGMNYILDYPYGLKDRVVIEDGFCFEKQKSEAFYTKNSDLVKISNWEDYARKNLNIMKDILANLPTPKNANKTIYVIHMPPANLNLGVTKFNNVILGSKEIYDFINRLKPMLTLHGHVHESPNLGKKVWVNKINDTDCIQPGQTEMDDEELVYVSLDLETKKYTRETCNVRDFNR